MKTKICIYYKNIRKPPSYYANLYKQYNIQGAHVIKLGPNNDEAAKEALSAWPGILLN